MVGPGLAATLFPNGVGQYLAGGLLIGVGVAGIYAFTGLTPGASTFLESTLTYVSDRGSLSRPALVASRDWRLVFTAGIVVGATSITVLSGADPWQTDVQAWRLGLGGVLVGLGTRLGKGCTSGHGICGVGSGSGTSVVNVVVFVLMAMGTAGLVAAVGVAP